MRAAKIALPYFDILLEQLNVGEASVQQAFGRHVHWGYWPEPAQADGSVEDFAIAAERLCQRVYQATGVEEGDRVLDAGCGFGGTIASLNEHFQALHLTGINIDPRQLERARQEVQPLNQNQIEFVEGDACQLPFPDESMDVVLAVECIFHFPSRADFFREARRVLRPGGKLGICDFVPIPLWRAFQRTLDRVSDLSFSGTYGRVDSYFTLEDYKALAQETGYYLAFQEDITRNTLPTYPAVRQLFKQTGYLDAARTTALIGWVSRLNFMRYQILRFSVEG